MERDVMSYEGRYAKLYVLHYFCTLLSFHECMWIFAYLYFHTIYCSIRSVFYNYISLTGWCIYKGIHTVHLGCPGMTSNTNIRDWKDTNTAVYKNRWICINHITVNTVDSHYLATWASMSKYNTVLFGMNQNRTRRKTTNI